MSRFDRPIPVGVLASGGGSNLQALIDRSEQGSLDAKIACVISNNSGSGALERARRHGIPAVHLSGGTHPDPGELDRAIRDALVRQGARLLALCGYMRMLGPLTLGSFLPCIVNIHPALLPKFGGKGMYGMHVHEAVLEAGETISGVTVHLVDEEYDRGAIVAQRQVPVLPDDTPESLQKRVLKEEHVLYAEVIQALADGSLVLEGGRPSRVLR